MSDFTFGNQHQLTCTAVVLVHKLLYYPSRTGSVIHATSHNSLTAQQETAMGSSDNDLNTLDNIITLAGALAAILGGVAGVAGLATFLGTGAGS
jgi:branched-subunit amino acid ABC-type transport system permease component